MTPRRKISRFWLPVGLAVLLLLIWFLSTPRKPFEKAGKIEILDISRHTFELFGEAAEGAEAKYTSALLTDRADAAQLAAQLSKQLRLLRTRRLPTIESLTNSVGGYQTPPVQYYVFFIADGKPYTLTVGSTDEVGWLITVDNRIYPIRDRAAWLALLEDLWKE